MRYTVKIKLSAEKELDRIPDKFYQQIAKHIIALSTQTSRHKETERRCLSYPCW